MTEQLYELKSFIRIERWLAAFIACILVVGCGSSTQTMIVPNPSQPVGLPIAPAATPENTYNGAQSPGAWTLALNDTQKTFSYQPTTLSSTPITPTSGSLTASNGFLNLGPSGYALEIQSRAVVFRPGDATTPPVFAVPQTACYSINGRMRFQFIGMQTGPDKTVGGAGPTLGYGSIVAATDSTGASWQFQDLQGNAVSGPASFDGNCATSASNAAISLSGSAVLNDLWPPNESIQQSLPTGAQSSLWIGPSGFVVADQSVPGSSSPLGASIAGVAEPASALNTTDINSQRYLGFLYEPATYPYGGATPSQALTAPVSFGQGGFYGALLFGGVYPNDDVTQTPATDIGLNLGSPDATYNGLYPSAWITVLDPDQNCANYIGSGETATTGINDQGFITCTFGAVVIAGNPGGKYALFVSSYNWAVQIGGTPMQIYLFQQ